MGVLARIFADLLVAEQVTPGESGESGENVEPARSAARSAVGDELAKSGESEVVPVRFSPPFAIESPRLNRPESKATQGFSPISPISPVSRRNDELTADPWTDDEIKAFGRRRDRLIRWGRSEDEAEATAERLVRRDREHDDRRMCIECKSLSSAGRCKAAAAGKFSWASRQLEPVQNLLQRCEGFVAAEIETKGVDRETQ